MASQRDALRLLHAGASEPGRLQKAVDAAVRASDATLRCAVPLNEAIDFGYSCGAVPPSSAVVAVDGSQVVPDRHEEVLYALINIGTVTMRANSGAAPVIDVDTTLLFGRDLYPGNGPLLSAGEIALRRDTLERASLLSQAAPAPGISIALLDGPLELWGSKDVSDRGAFERALAEYLADLREMEHRGWTVAGYVDKPGADLVVRLLEISIAASDDLKRLRSYHPLQGVSDRWLMGQLLGSQQRSAVYAMQSTSREKYPDSLSIHFFYVNVGSERHPLIARVEIPKWVAGDGASIDALHGVLLEQCLLLGVRPYPYILHRAHETAKISEAENEQIKLRLLLELRQNGVEPEARSAKSSVKAQSEIKGRF
jgi:hypothetical protein